MRDSATWLQKKISAVINPYWKIDDSQVRNNQSMFFEEFEQKNDVGNSSKYNLVTPN
jgi:hypothetical protein